MDTVKIAVGPHEFAYVDGRVFGIVAVTSALDGFGKCRVITHLKTGYAMTPPIKSRVKAVKLAKLIDSQPHIFENLSTKRKTKYNKRAAELLHTFWLQCGLERYW